MSIISKIFERNLIKNVPRGAAFYSTKTEAAEEDPGEFRVLNLRAVKRQWTARSKIKKPDVLPPRCDTMPVDQNWGNVWPGPRTFHPATVPLPIRQGYVEKGASPPFKYANAELMKIPNFLHLTPPVIKRQCEALKKFCTPFPETLKNDAVCERQFPLEITSSNYCHSSPSIRDPLARIVTIRFKLVNLKLDARARDKFLRLVGERYDENTDCITIVADRCPTKKQNQDYALYLITALYHESWNVEPWEKLKSDADMEHYDWELSASKKSLEQLFGKSATEIPNGEEYSKAVHNMMNEGENNYTLGKYSESVRKLLGLPLKPET